MQDGMIFKLTGIKLHFYSLTVDLGYLISAGV